jgi:hypothetical protein
LARSRLERGLPYLLDQATETREQLRHLGPRRARFARVGCDLEDIEARLDARLAAGWQALIDANVAAANARVAIEDRYAFAARIGSWAREVRGRIALARTRIPQTSAEQLAAIDVVSDQLGPRTRAEYNAAVGMLRRVLEAHAGVAERIGTALGDDEPWPHGRRLLAEIEADAPSLPAKQAEVKRSKGGVRAEQKAMREVLREVRSAWDAARSAVHDSQAMPPMAWAED